MILFSVLALCVVTDADDYFGAVGDVSGVSVGKEAGWSLLLAELDYSVKKSPWAEHRHGQPWLGLTGVSQNPPVLWLGFASTTANSSLGKEGHCFFF